MELELEAFLIYLRDIKRASKNTIDSYRNDLNKLILYLQGQNINSVEKINETNLNSYVLHLEREGRKAATVSRNIATMKSFLLYLIKQGKLKSDPSERLKPPKVEKQIPKALSLEQVECLFAQPNLSTKKGLRDKAMLEVLYATGMRVSELIALTLNDVNLKNGYIQWSGDAHHKGRVVPIGKVAAQALELYLKEGRPVLVGALPTDILFPNRFGQAMTRQGVWKMLKGYCKMAGITQDVTPQLLRHTFAMHLVQNGADLRSVQELLGHSDISTTQLYVQVRKEKVREVYEKTFPRA